MNTEELIHLEEKSTNIIIGILYSMRPKQWSKNLLIFAGIIFSQKLFYLPILLKVILGFIVFSLISGCVYIVNDIIWIIRGQIKNTFLKSGIFFY